MLTKTKPIVAAKHNPRIRVDSDEKAMMGIRRR
jgi:hypothetical protein